MGCGSIVVTDNDPALAADEAQALAAQFWARRRAFEVEHFTVTEAVARGRKVEGGPVLLVDTADCARAAARPATASPCCASCWRWKWTRLPF